MSICSQSTHRTPLIFLRKLDFRELERIAREQEELGAFDEDGTIAKAPLRLDHLPAAFYKVATPDYNQAAVHTPREPEILAVVNGVLSIADARHFAAGHGDTRTAIYSGEVVKLAPETVQMKALGVFNPVKCLALAIYNMPPRHPGLIIRG